MAAITFTPKTATSASSGSAPATETITAEVVVAPPSAVAIATPPVTSNISRSDIVLPRINLVQKVGKLGDDFAPGSFLFQQQIVLAKPNEEFVAVVLDDKKYFQEKVEYGSSEFGRRAESEEEVRSLGGTVTWGIPDKPYFQSVADFLLAVAAPDNTTEEQLEQFPFLFKDRHYAMAVYTVASSAYTSLAKRIFTDKLFTLKDGLHLAEYRIKSGLKRNADNSWYVPIPSMPKRYNDPEKAKFFEELNGV